MLNTIEKRAKLKRKAYKGEKIMVMNVLSIVRTTVERKPAHGAWAPLACNQPPLIENIRG